MTPRNPTSFRPAIAKAQRRIEVWVSKIFRQVPVKVQFSSSGRIKLEWHKVQTIFSRIALEEYLRFDDDVASGKNVVYISVFAQDCRIFANGLQRYSDIVF